MKPNLIFIGLLFFLIGIVSSCTEDCPDGYFGKDCAERESDKFEGIYEGWANCGLNNEYSEIEIKRDEGPFDVIIDITTTPDFIFEASVSDDSIFLREQILELDQGNEKSYYFIFESAGIFNNDTLKFDLIILPAGISNPQKITCKYQVVK